MLSRETFLNVLKFEQAIGNKANASEPAESISVKVQKIIHPDGSWNFKTSQVLPEEVKKGLGDIIGALQKRELKTDVLTKENK